MAGIRIRWRGVARVAAILVVGLIVVRLLPGFLRAPEPPPLGAGVGLPRAKPATEAPRGEATKPVTDIAGRGADRSASRPRKRRRSRPQQSRTRPAGAAPASTAVIASSHRPTRRHRSHDPNPESPAARTTPAPKSTSPPVSEYVPPPAAEPVPEALPEPAPSPRSTPGDGSEEFAPH